jgi:hypothetical protein
MRCRLLSTDDRSSNGLSSCTNVVALVKLATPLRGVIGTLSLGGEADRLRFSHVFSDAKMGLFGGRGHGKSPGFDF